MLALCSAETQGMTDKYISSWLRQQKRDGVVLATKVAGYGNQYLRKNGDETRITAKQVEESVNGSLQRLGTDYIDLLQVLCHLCCHAVCHRVLVLLLSHSVEGACICFNFCA